MIDKVQKIRETVENRYEYWKKKESNSHSIESEIRMSECKHLLLMLDSLQEEPVSDDFEMALAEMIDKAQTSVVEPWVIAAQWKDELIKLAKSEEPVSEELEEACKKLAENARKHKAETSSPFFCQTDYKQGVIDGAEWHKEQLMAKAVETTFNVSLPSGLCDLLWIKGYKVWDKLLVIKKDEL